MISALIAPKASVLLDFDDILATYKSKEHGIKALSQYKSWFPLKASPELAGITADLIGDGHLQSPPKSRLDYCSKYTSELERFNLEIYNLFAVKGKIRDCTTNRYNTKNLGINNKPLVRVLEKVGVPIGAKVFTPFPVPAWILKDKALFSRFINRLFSCEGNVDLYSKCIEFRMFKSVDLLQNGLDFFHEIKSNLEEYFAIKSTKPFLYGKTNMRKDGRETRGIRLKIKDKGSLLNFKRFVGFDDQSKQKRLDFIIEKHLNQD